MKELIVYSNSDIETKDIARYIGGKAFPSMVITLEGDLGAGKTTFTKGFADSLDVKRNVNSPTFTIIKEYNKGRLPLYHMDVYRLSNSDEDLGFDEYFYGEGVCVIEWASIIKDLLPEERLDIFIYLKGETQREIEIKAYGNRYEEVLSYLEKKVKS